MRKILIAVLGLVGLGALSYIAQSRPDCATRLSWCLSDPPLFIKLQGMNVPAYCRNELKDCREHFVPIAAETAAGHSTRRKAEFIEFSSAF